MMQDVMNVVMLNTWSPSKWSARSVSTSSTGNLGPRASPPETKPHTRFSLWVGTKRGSKSIPLITAVSPVSVAQEEDTHESEEAGSRKKLTADQRDRRDECWIIRFVARRTGSVQVWRSALREDYSKPAWLDFPEWAGGKDRRPRSPARISANTNLPKQKSEPDIYKGGNSARQAVQVVKRQ